MALGERRVECIRSHPAFAVGQQVTVNIRIDEVVECGGEVPCAIMTLGKCADDYEGVHCIILFYYFEGVAVANMEGSNVDSGVD